MTEENQILDRQAIIERISQKIPRHSLAHYPTPLMQAKRMSATLDNTQLWFKRDDLISFGLGGNKIRGLEVMLADALAQNANWLVTGAGVQSNHVRATAAVAAHVDMRCTAVYWGQPPTAVDGNYRVSQMLGAAFHFTGNDDRALVDTHIQQVAAQLRTQGQCPYAIPRGGACVMGVLGHVLAVFELYQQCLAQSVEPDAIVLAVGSGGTYAGWLLGLKLLNLPWKMLCYTVSREPEQVSRQVADLATGAAVWLQFDWKFNTTDAPVIGGFIGQGYGIPSPEAANAIKQVGRAEGILLDPIYTGKAIAGFLHDLQNQSVNETQTTIFIHTGGEPAFFAGNGGWLNTA